MTSLRLCSTSVLLGCFVVGAAIGCGDSGETSGYQAGPAAGAGGEPSGGSNGSAGSSSSAGSGAQGGAAGTAGS